MSAGSPDGLTIAVLIFDGLTLLDAIGPYEVLSRLPNATVEFVAADPAPIRDRTSVLSITPTATLDQLPAPDVLLVPGGPGVAGSARDARVLAWLAAAHTTSRATAAVCTGALLLGAAGLLAGRRATTHWLALDQLAAHDAMTVRQRVVSDGRIITAAGVSAGIDMALTLAARLADTSTAQAIQLSIEYAPEPPFNAGSPDTAPPAIVKRLTELADRANTST